MSSEEYRDLRDGIQAQSDRTEERSGEVDVILERIHARFDRIDRRFEQLETTLRAEIRESAVETRRYMDTLYEKFHADVQRVFEGYDHQATVLDNHEHRIQALEHPRLRFDG